MAVIYLESLVLRGVSVVINGGSASNLRLGTGYTAKQQNPATRLTMRHPSPDPRQDFNRPAAIEPAVSDRGADAGVGGAGRWTQPPQEPPQEPPREPPREPPQEPPH